MMGRQPGVSGGLGGAMQFIDTENNFYCGSIVGSGTAIAVGMAMAMKQMPSDRVCLCIFGDGASNTGTFHESLNLAAIWQLPIIYLCENNQYAEAMPAREFIASQRISDRAHSYGLEPITIDGNDVEQTFATAQETIAKIRCGKGPILIEALTYRIRGHYVGDPEQTYRSKAEVNEWKGRCPLQRCRSRLLDIETDPTQLYSVEEEILSELDADKDWVISQPFTTIEQAIAHVMIPLE
jgi:pyruvate dehydrogenase E1 component alpha subunit